MRVSVLLNLSPIQDVILEIQSPDALKTPFTNFFPVRHLEMASPTGLLLQLQTELLCPPVLKSEPHKGASSQPGSQGQAVAASRLDRVQSRKDRSSSSILLSVGNLLPNTAREEEEETLRAELS